MTFYFLGLNPSLTSGEHGDYDAAAIAPLR